MAFQGGYCLNLAPLLGGIFSVYLSRGLGSYFIELGYARYPFRRLISLAS
jgi:hypothetical protein